MSESRKYYQNRSRQDSVREAIASSDYEIEKIIKDAQAVIEERTIEDWRDEALCSTMDPKKFDTDIINKQEVEVAQRICQSCKVSQKCLALVMGADLSRDSMIYAGLKPDQILKLKQRTARSLR